MKIASVQMQTEVSKSKSSVEPKQDEFSNVLSQAITKESESPNKNESLDQEPKDENDEDAKKLVDSMVGMLNVSFVEITEPNVIPEELISPVTDKNTLSIDSVYTTLDTIGSVSKTNDLSSNMNNIENIKFTEESSPVEDIIPFNEEKLSVESMPLIKQNSNLEGDGIAKLTEKSTYNKTLTEQNLVKENLVDEDILINRTSEITKKIDGPNIQEVTKELEPKENVVVKENQDLKFMDINHLKNFNNITLKSIDSKEPVLFNDNLQKINDTIIQLIETTTEGNTNVIKVKLFPENLGTVNVTLRMEEGRLIAKILVDNDYVKSLFANKVNELNESLVKQNIHLEKINIDLNLNSNSNNNSNFDLNQNGTFSQGRENHSRRNKYEIFNNEFVNTAIQDEHILNSGAISILA